MAALVLCVPRPVAAGDALTARPSLKGIGAFRVIVEQLGPKVEKTAGLRREDLQADVESRLAHAGVAMSGDAPALLDLNVAVVCNGITCAYNVALEVQQKKLYGNCGCPRQDELDEERCPSGVLRSRMMSQLNLRSSATRMSRLALSLLMIWVVWVSMLVRISVRALSRSVWMWSSRS